MGVFVVTATGWGGPLPRLELGFFKISDLRNSAAPPPNFPAVIQSTKSLPGTFWPSGQVDRTPDVFGRWEGPARQAVGGIERLPGLGWSRSPFGHQQNVTRCRALRIRRHLPPGPTSFCWSRRVCNSSFPWCMLSARLQAAKPACKFLIQKPPWRRTGLVSLHLPCALGWVPPLLTCYHTDKKGHS